ncbi:MAG: glycoside hydrolase family 3 C-terminal domain-containing protein [Anaerolineae bacterium]|nr:glycoside hydrolase family 3 C-terminal domain-containing protein [Anaerolineae bacterium]
MTIEQLPYQNPSVPVRDRVSDLISRMTLEEKVSQMVYDAPAIERLGIPEYNWWNECLHGVSRAGIATVFPQAIGLAATWNTVLMRQISTAISDEARAKHHDFLRRGVRRIYTGLTFWSPNVNIFRDPRWGRGQETYGECPYLTARMGVEFVKGLQGDDPRYLKLVATAKHYAVHSGPEPDRHTFDARVDERDLRETYLPAFKALVQESGAVSVMGAYNRTNGEACCASPTLLLKILRDEWGFGGATGLDAYAVSDCWAIRDIWANHKLVDTPEEAASLAVKNGCDLNCGVTYPALVEAAKLGLIDEATIDRSVKRLFIARFRLGMFDPPERVPYSQIPYAVVNSPEHQALALQAARESIVLLKNDERPQGGRLLPLSKNISSVAVIGPNIDDLLVLEGNYNGTPAEGITPLEGIRRKVSKDTVVYAARGCHIAEGIPPLVPVPSACLRPLCADAEQTGLTAAYFANEKFAGDPARVGVDPLVDFSWKLATPVSGERGDPFSVRWEGYLIPPVSGVYKLGARGFNAYHLELDGEPVVEYRGEHHPITQTKDIALEAGRLYPIRLEMSSTDADPQMQILWAVPGVDYETPALDAARNAEVVVMVMGLTAGLEGEEMPIHVPGFAGGDRTDIGLAAPQQALLEKVHALGKPVVLVLTNGSALAVNWAQENISAIVEAWYPGEAGGTALADVLFGDYNPAGRLPVTFYKSVGDLPPFDDYDMEGHTYRYFRGEPLYPFGFGLSYTEFSYRNFTPSTDTIAAGEGVAVSVEVRNVGEVDGDEVVQLYVTDLEASVPVPIRQLCGFKRVHLAAGESQSVTFEIAPRQLSLIDDAGRRVVEPGAFQIAVGGRQPTVGDSPDSVQVACTTLNVVGEITPIAE